MNTWYTSPVRILIVDDDLDLLNLLGFALRTAGYETESATNGADALKALQFEKFTVVILDINMPAPNGLSVCESLRKTSNVPVLMLSARDREEDLLQALDVGADAYLTKPFSPRVLITRIRALIRRAHVTEPRIVSSSGIKLDLNELSLTYGHGSISLTRLEIRLLRFLMANAGKSVSHNELVTEIWSGFGSANRNSLKQVVFRLRRKLAVAPDVQCALKTVEGQYMWSEDDIANVPLEMPASSFT